MQAPSFLVRLAKGTLEMRDFRDAKLMAQSLKKALSEKSIASSHGECLDLISQAFGFTGWNVLAAKIDTNTAACSLCGKTPPHLVDIGTAQICPDCMALCVDAQNCANAKRFPAANSAPGSVTLEDLTHGQSTDTLEKHRAVLVHSLTDVETMIGQATALIDGSANREEESSPFAGLSRDEVLERRAVLRLSLDGSLKTIRAIDATLQERASVGRVDRPIP